MRKIAVLIVFLLLAMFPQVSSNIWIKTYLPSTPIQGGTYFNGTVYIVGPSMNGMLLIALHDNGSPEWIVEYRVGDYTLFPRTATVHNGSIFIAAKMGDMKCLVMRIHPNGSVIWAKEVSSKFRINPMKILVVDNRIMVVGHSNESTAILMLDENGNVTWSKRYYLASLYDVFPNDATSGPNGTALIVGDLQEPWEPYDFDAFVLDINQNGNPRWLRLFKFIKGFVSSNSSFSVFNTAQGVAVTPNGTVVVGGGFSRDFFLMGLDSNGTILWKLVGTPSSMNVGFVGIPLVLPNGDILLESSTYKNVLIMVTSNSGGLKWGGRFTVPPYGFYSSSDFESNGKVYIVGFTSDKTPAVASLSRKCLERLCLPLKPEKINLLNISPTVIDAGIKVVELPVKVERVHVSEDRGVILERPAHSTVLVHVTSTPKNATLIVDGMAVENTPTNISLFPGFHTFNLGKRNYFNTTKEITIPPGDESTLQFKLRPIPGELNISTFPSGAMVYLNDTYKGKTPLSRSVAPGSYSLTVSLSGYHVYRRNVTILPNKTLALNVTLNPLPGRLEVSSDPQGIQVYIRRLSTGRRSSECTSPCNLSLEPGRYNITALKKRGNITLQNSTVAILRPNETLKVSLILPGILKIKGTGEINVTGVFKTSCRTPCQVTLPAGKYVLAWKNRATVTVRPGETIIFELPRSKVNIWLLMLILGGIAVGIGGYIIYARSPPKKMNPNSNDGT